MAPLSLCPMCELGDISCFKPLFFFFISYEVEAFTLSVEVYEEMINRGWRRSGRILYKPHLEKTCCPQYPIRLSPSEFKPSKKHRQLVHKFVRFLKGEWMSDVSIQDPIQLLNVDDPEPSRQRICCCQVLSDSTHSCPFPSHASSIPSTFNLLTAFSEAHHSLSAKHSFRVFLEPASETLPKYRLFEKYQRHVHHDPPSSLSIRNFANFLVTTPFPTPPSGRYGSFHLLYMLNNTLLAVSVLDVLPQMVSSVYFFYDPEYMFLQLGKLSVLYELTWVSLFKSELNQAVSRSTYNLGYYVETCPKMCYKAQFHPSQLLDASTWTWVPFDAGSNPKLSRNENKNTCVPQDEIDALLIREYQQVYQLKQFNSQTMNYLISEMATLLELSTLQKIVFFLP
ncbi:Arginyl-tRNA--protein transferase 1 [Coelomomyces lativittatus]|nr:Arginyl-tRNA--protein transferase 1 [Coelomomyces lativittatus]